MISYTVSLRDCKKGGPYQLPERFDNILMIEDTSDPALNKSHHHRAHSQSFRSTGNNNNNEESNQLRRYNSCYACKERQLNSQDKNHLDSPPSLMNLMNIANQKIQVEALDAEE